jgi:hypothetical protein
MRSRVLSLIGIGATALATVAASASAASASAASAPAAGASAGGGSTLAARRPAVTAAFRPAAAGQTCYSQLTNNTGNSVVSQNFTDQPAFSSQGADDFLITKTCTVTGVEAAGGYFNGFGPANSVGVTFYQNTKRAPGAVLSTQPENRYSDPTGTGNFTVRLKKPVTLKPGIYWVSVQANMARSYGGEWGWDTDSVQVGSAARWRNPGNGFRTGCKTYLNMQICASKAGATDAGPGFEFAILGAS